MDKNLKEKVVELLNMKQEGEYRDFKQCWYDDSKKEDLLFDIINMANNVTDEDGLIIIGIENDTFKVAGVENDEKRRNTQNLVDFIFAKDKHFLGGNRPIVRVENIELEEHTLDVIVIQNTMNVPYVLEEKYRQIHSNHVYVRNQDSNTPKDQTAPFYVQEKLWRRRFGIDKTALEKLQILLMNKEDWIDDANGNVYYNKFFPEFRIVKEEDETRDGDTFLIVGQTNSKFQWYTVKAFYHQTMLVEHQGLSIDSGRAFVIMPEWNTTVFPSKRYYHYYRYYIKNSMEHLLFELFRRDNKFYSDESDALCKYLEWVLQFNSEEERQDFNNYLDIHFSETQLQATKVAEEFDPNSDGLGKKANLNDCRRAKYFQNLFSKY